MINRSASAIQFSGIFAGCELPDRFEPSGKILDCNKIAEACAQLIETVGMGAHDSRVFDREVHSFDLVVGSRVVCLR